MAIANINARFQFQKMTKSEWEEWGDILLDGELAYEADTRKMKIGDGKHKYIDLPYIEIGEIRVSDLSEEDRKKLTGPKGEPGKALRFEDLNTEQKKELKGEGIKDINTGEFIKVWRGSDLAFKYLEKHEQNVLYLII